MRKFIPAEQKPAVDEPVEPKLAKTEVEVVQGWQAKDGSFHKSKVDAVTHNRGLEADEIVKAATADVQKLIGDINNKLDEDLYWKREFTDEERAAAATSGQAMKDGSFPIKSEDDLKNAIRVLGRAQDQTVAKAHIITRAKALDLEAALPDDWKQKKHKKVLKGLYDVGRAACLLDELDWMHSMLAFEADSDGEESPATNHLSDIIKELCSFLTTLVEEECGDIVENHGGDADVLEAAVKLPSRHAIAVTKHLKPGKILDAVKKAEEDDDEDAHPSRVKAIHKCAGRVMQSCMKAMHSMHDDDQDDDDDDAEKVTKSVEEASKHMKSAHAAGNDIVQHCMKMGSKVESSDADDDNVHKLAKAEAVNSALSKSISETTAKLGDLLKRIDHLERQPAVRKGQLFDVKASHEALPGNAPVETDMSTYDALRLPPEAERRIAFGTR